MKVINYKKHGETIELAVEATDDEIGFLISVALDVLIAANQVSAEELDQGGVEIDLASLEDERFYQA